MVAHRLDGQRASAAPAAAGTHCGRPYFGWVCSSPRRWLRSGGRRLGLLPGCGGWWRDQLWLHLGRTLFLVVLIIFVVMMGSCLR